MQQNTSKVPNGLRAVSAAKRSGNLKELLQRMPNGNTRQVEENTVQKSKSPNILQSKMVRNMSQKPMLGEQI